MLHLIAEHTLSKPNSLITKYDTIENILSYINKNKNKKLLCFISDKDIENILTKDHTIIQVNYDSMEILDSYLVKDIRDILGMLLPGKSYNLKPDNLLNLINSIYNNYLDHISKVKCQISLQNKIKDKR